MSLVRLGLRAATVAALNNNGSAPYPTMAGALVFDSKQDPLEHLTTETLLPAIVIYTGDDRQENMDRGTGRSYRERVVDLIIDCVIGTWTEENGITAVETDPEMEAMLDIFEWQVWRVFNDSSNEHALALNKMVKRYDSWSSIPVRDAKQANRHAIRQMTIECVIANDCYPSLECLAPGATRELPEVTEFVSVPYLSDMNSIIATEAAFEVLREQLREVITGVPVATVPPLQNTVMKTDAIDPADPNRLELLGQTKGPDGRIEYEINIDMEN